MSLIDNYSLCNYIDYTVKYSSKLKLSLMSLFFSFIQALPVPLDRHREHKSECSPQLATKVRHLSWERRRRDLRPRWPQQGLVLHWRAPARWAWRDHAWQHPQWSDALWYKITPSTLHCTQHDEKSISYTITRKLKRQQNSPQLEEVFFYFYLFSESRLCNKLDGVWKRFWGDNSMFSLVLNWSRWLCWYW